MKRKQKSRMCGVHSAQRRFSQYSRYSFRHIALLQHPFCRQSFFFLLLLFCVPISFFSFSCHNNKFHCASCLSFDFNFAFCLPVFVSLFSFLCTASSFSNPFPFRFFPSSRSSLHILFSAVSFFSKKHLFVHCFNG